MSMRILDIITKNRILIALSMLIIGKLVLNLIVMITQKKNLLFLLILEDHHLLVKILFLMIKLKKKNIRNSYNIIVRS